MCPAAKKSSGRTGSGRPGRHDQRSAGARLLARAAMVVGGATALLLLFLAGAYVLQEEPPEEGMTSVRQVGQIFALAVDPGAPDQFWLASEEGVIRLVDGRLFRVGPQQVMQSLIVLPAAAGEPVLLGSGHLPGTVDELGLLGLVESRDRGHTWERVSLGGQGLLHALAGSSRADGVVLYGWNLAAQNGFMRSLDGGASWETVASEAEGILNLAADPADAEHLIGASEEGLLVSRDGGQTWIPGRGSVRGTLVTAVAFDPVAEDTLYAFAPGFLRGLMISDDGGASWRQLGLTPAEGDMVWSIAAANPDVIYASTLQRHLWHTQDGGATWEHLMADGMPVRN